MKTFTLLFFASMTPGTKAQYFTETYFSDYAAVDEVEQTAFQETKATETKVMDEAISTMKKNEKKKEYERAREKGELNAPDGTPITENADLATGIRPVDPRTPKGFGNPLMRVSAVKESFKTTVLDAGISEEDLIVIETLLEEGEEIVFNETGSTMMFLHVEPRSMCGIDLDHAQDWCGPTCDPSIPFCVMGAVDDIDGYEQTVDSKGKYINWGRCFENALCLNEDKHSLILDDGEECQTKVVENPCPNPCDCLKKNKRSRCHEFCKRTDSNGVIQCKIERGKGELKRENKVAKELDNSKACAYNVYYEHPMMYNEVLEVKRLPGLFGTF